MKISQQQKMLLETLEELADERGVTPEELLNSLPDPDPTELEGIPESLLKQLESAKEQRHKNRSEQRQKSSEELIAAQIASLKKHFPSVKPEDIPPEVWKEAASGEDLAGCYALYLCDKRAEEEYAGSVNADAEARAASPAADGDTEAAFTKEMVEKMSRKDIGKNYKGILASIKKWRI